MDIFKCCFFFFSSLSAFSMLNLHKVYWEYLFCSTLFFFMLLIQRLLQALFPFFFLSGTLGLLHSYRGDASLSFTYCSSLISILNIIETLSLNWNFIIEPLSLKLSFLSKIIIIFIFNIAIRSSSYAFDTFFILMRIGSSKSL